MTTVASTQPQTPSEVFASLGLTKTAASSAKSSQTASDIQDRFLALLTAQMKNQDPLNPLDNAQVTTQLAQINTVNGVEKLNATMNKLMAAFDNAQTMQAANMIGRGVLVPGSELPLHKGVALGGVGLDSAADSVMVSIMDANGKVVDSENLGARAAGTFTFMWDGKLADGSQLPDGKYSISVTAQRGPDKLKPEAMQVGTVNAVTRSGTDFILDLGALGTVTFDQVQQIL